MYVLTKKESANEARPGENDARIHDCISTCGRLPPPHSKRAEGTMVHPKTKTKHNNIYFSFVGGVLLFDSFSRARCRECATSAPCPEECPEGSVRLANPPCALVPAAKRMVRRRGWRFNIVLRILSAFIIIKIQAFSFCVSNCFSSSKI